MECYCTNHCACQPEALMQCRQEVRFKFISRSNSKKYLNFEIFDGKLQKYILIKERTKIETPRSNMSYCLIH